MQPEQVLRIIKVERLPQSYQSYRYLNRKDLKDPNRYPVRLWLSRRVDPFERDALAQQDILVDERDPMQAYLHNTTLEDVRELLTGLNDDMAAAEQQARRTREDSEREDARLDSLVDEINAQLGFKGAQHGD